MERRKIKKQTQKEKEKKNGSIENTETHKTVCLALRCVVSFVHCVHVDAYVCVQLNAFLLFSSPSLSSFVMNISNF